MSQQQGPGGRVRLELRPDCADCLGLCCVALPFSASSDFAMDKAAGTPCPNLRPDLRCSIHRDLRGRGFAGCAVFDCFGAGQKVSQVTFHGRDWRQDDVTAEQMFQAFAVMRQLHELLWYLAQAVDLPAAGPLRERLRAALDDTERLTASGPDALVSLDVAAHRERVNVLLLGASELVRAGYPRRDHRRADLTGARLRGADLRGADLRGALLLGADLRRADLRAADLIGADVRNADLGGADLRESLFATQAQLEAARGDDGTRLPPFLTRPAHWAQVPRPRPGRPPGRRSRR